MLGSASQNIDFFKEEFGLVEAPSTEPTPQSTNGSASVLSPPVRPSEETISVERDSPRILDVVSPKSNGSTTPVTKITPLAADTSDSRPTQGTNLTILASGPAPSMENAVAQEAQIQVRQGAAIKVKDRPVEPAAQTAHRDERLHAASTGEPSNVVDKRSREDTVAVATSATEIIALVAAAPVVHAAVTAAAVDEAPEPAVQEPHEAKQTQQIAFADPVAALSVESVVKIDDLAPVPAAEVIATETAAQLEPRLTPSTVDKVEEARDVAELAEISTPAPELVVLVEETPGQEISADGAAQVSAAKPEVVDGAAPQLDDAASQPVAAELQATLEADVSSITRPVEVPCVEAALAADTSLQVAVVETDHAADQVPELAAEEAQTHVQVTAAEAPLIKVIPSPEVKVDVSAGNVSASHVGVAPAEVEAQAAPESFFHDSGPTAAADAHEFVEAAPAISPEIEVETQEPVAGTVEVITLAEEAQPSVEAELPTQVHEIQAADVLSPGSNQEATTAALATVVEVVAVTAEAQSAPDVPAEAHISAPESAPVKVVVEVIHEASEPAPSTVTEPEPVEDKAVAEPVTEEAQVLAHDPAPNASEPVAITPDVPAPIEPSSASAPQFVVDEAADPPVVAVAVSAPEEIIVVEAAVDTVDEPRVAAEAEPALREETVVVVSASEPEAPAAEPTVDEVVAEPLAAQQAEETVVVVGASEPEAPVAEPAVVEVIVLAPAVEDAPAPVEAGASAPVAIEAPEQVVTSQPEGRSD